MRHKTVCTIVVFWLALFESTRILAEFSFKINPDSTITITGFSGLGLQAIIRNEIDGRIVTRFGDHAFQGSGMTDISIPDSATSIGNYAVSGDPRIENSFFKPTKRPMQVKVAFYSILTDNPNRLSTSTRCEDLFNPKGVTSIGQRIDS